MSFKESPPSWIDLIDPSKFEEFYAIGVTLYREKNYHDALFFFRQLALFKPNEAKYWKGLGACLQMLKEFESAIPCYEAVNTLFGNPELSVYFHLVDCHLGLNQREKAVNVLKAAKTHAKKTKDQQGLKHVKLLESIWTKPLKRGATK